MSNQSFHDAGQNRESGGYGTERVDYDNAGISRDQHGRN